MVLDWMPKVVQNWMPITRCTRRSARRPARWSSYSVISNSVTNVPKQDSMKALLTAVAGSA